MHNFKELVVWQKARILVKEVYEISSKFPSEEKFGIISQIRRATISISNNISEGCGRKTKLDFIHFLHISLASSYEVENMIYLCFDLDFITIEKQNDLIEKVQEIQKMLYKLIQSIKTT